MFETFRNAWKIEDLRKKLLYTLLVIVIFRLGCAIPVPFIAPEALQGWVAGQSGSMLGYIDMAHRRFVFPRDAVRAERYAVYQRIHHHPASHGRHPGRWSACPKRERMAARS